MDARELQQQQHQHQHQQNILMRPTSYSTGANMIPPQGQSAAARFPFNTLAPQSPSQSQQQQQSQQQARQIESFNSTAVSFDGSPATLRPAAGVGGGFGMDPNKKKRGRPRKYTPDGNIALRLAPTQPPASHVVESGGVGGSSGGGGGGDSASEPPAKRNRGRPPGSGKRQLDALGGVGGVGFTPHVITVKTGEDIASKIMAFSQQGPRTVCVLSANGAICNVTLRQPAMSGGTVTYESVEFGILEGSSKGTYTNLKTLSSEGRFEIISLSGSFFLTENNGNRSRSGCLSVSLAGPDGRVLGGGVAGLLLAATPVQVIVGSFIQDGKKSNSNMLKSGSSSAPTSHMLNFGGVGTSTPPSDGSPSESSDDNGGSSPLNRGGGGGGLFNNSGGSQQPMHSMHMYQLWASQTQQ